MGLNVRRLIGIAKTDSSFAVSLQATRLLCGAATTVIIGRFLLADDVAAWFFCLNIFAMVQLSEYGFCQVVQRQLSQQTKTLDSDPENDADIFDLAVVGALCSSLLPVVFTGSGALFGLWGARGGLYFLASLQAGAVSLFTAILGYTLASHAIKKSQIAAALQAFLILGVTSICAGIFRNLEAVLTGQAILYVLASLMVLKSVDRGIPKARSIILSCFQQLFQFVKKERKSILNILLVVISFQAMTRFFNITLAGVMSEKEFAAYGISLQLLGAVVALANSIFQVKLPSIVKDFSRGNRAWKPVWIKTQLNATGLQCAFSVGIVVFIILGVAEIIWPNFKINAGFTAMISAILILEVLIGNMSITIVNFMEERHLRLNILCAIIIIAVCVCLAPYFSYWDLYMTRAGVYLILCGIPTTYLAVRMFLRDQRIS